MAAIEVLHLFVKPDGSDTILRTKKFSGGDQPKIDYLFHSPLILMVSQDENYAGVLVKNPENIEAELYRDMEDAEGIILDGCSLIQIKPGQELRIGEIGSPRELWFVFDRSESAITMPLMQSPVAV